MSLSINTRISGMLPTAFALDGALNGVDRIGFTQAHLHMALQSHSSHRHPCCLVPIS